MPEKEPKPPAPEILAIDDRFVSHDEFDILQERHESLEKTLESLLTALEKAGVIRRNK